jgi:SAM-dependent methyltransferase
VPAPDRVERREDPYGALAGDAVRGLLEQGVFERIVPRLLRLARGGRVLDLGCGDNLAASLAGAGLERYVGVDLRARDPQSPHEVVLHDLREGLGPVGSDPYDVYLATFGTASHLSPAELGRLLADVRAHARPNAIVAFEALGLHSLEWPRIWGSARGPRRMLPYRLTDDVRVHPWAAGELAELYEAAGIRHVFSFDRTVQAGPKLRESRYWPGLPPVRDGLNALLGGDAGGIPDVLAPLPPLPAHPAAELHQALAARRADCVARLRDEDPATVARAVWALEPSAGSGAGHGLLVVGRVN